MEWFTQGDFATTPTNVPAFLLGLLLAFLCGHALAWIYIKTHTGLSYSRTFVNSLIVIPMLVALVMQVLANNLVTAFGMMAVFAIVRFRNILRDTLDTVYILTCISCGMGCGTQKYTTAILGCLLVLAVLVYLHATEFGVRHRYDLIINLHWNRTLLEIAALQEVLRRHSRRTQCASQRSVEGIPGTDISYRLLLRDPARAEELIAELRDTHGVSRVTSLQAQDESEM
jgi:hypothetical protein